MEQLSEQRSASVSRWGGAIIAVGALAYAIAVVLFVIMYGQPAGTGPGGEVTLADRVAHYQGQQQIAHTMWFVELVAAILLAIAGLVLQQRPRERRTTLPPLVAWTTVSVGALILSLMYPVMLGGYPAAVAGEGLVLFDVLNSIATVFFHMGNVVLGLGLAGVFFIAATSGDVLPKWLAITGTVLFLVWTMAALGLLAGLAALEALAPLGLLGFLLTAYFGFALARHGV